MKLFKFKSMAMIGAMSLAGVGLIGVGTHATYFSTAGASQTINTGTLAVSASSTTGTCATMVGTNCEAWTLPLVAGVGSTFDTGPLMVTLTNTGTLPAWYKTQAVTLSTTGGGNFAADANVCQFSVGTGGHYAGLNYDGSIAGAPAALSFSEPPPSEGPSNAAIYEILPGQSDSLSVDFYAGGAAVQGSPCNAAAIPSLTNVDEGQGATLTFAYTWSDTPNV
jgi:hypothetical protein